ncbi:helix-turn-helix transcriptional regulator [Pseudomonas rhodesiae]|uniref:helix-turn-helix domain-containing protein n=1 Tax=Pseudomonas rhodesiae TaxID=76760 RepID=UPI002737195C|nr:helix-turn-helix transcriptional regulator [Pseudomonas rhodesiae]WLI30581.1 helix-turn-helix transcriptional regulator [Pseudomonas rhodesiae]
MLSQPCRVTPLIGAPASASKISDSQQHSFIHHMTCNCTRQHGYILSFEDIILLKPALAAVVRAVRGNLGFTQENLAHAASRTYLSKIENAESSPTIDKFVELAEALGMSPLAFMALILSTRDKTPSSALLAEAAEELKELQKRVSDADIAAHLAGIDLVKRPAARPVNLLKLKKVLECKEIGLSKAETARRLGISRSTVGFLWERSVPAEG